MAHESAQPNKTPKRGPSDEAEVVFASAMDNVGKWSTAELMSTTLRSRIKTDPHTKYSIVYGAHLGGGETPSP